MRIRPIACGLAALLLFTLCFGLHAQQAAGSLRIGYQKYGSLVLLKARGTLEPALAKLGVRVQWIEFPGGPQLLEGLNVGGVDFGVAGETPPVFAQAAGADLRYVAYEPSAPTSEAILIPADSPLHGLKDLKGRKIALNKGSNVHYLLVQALRKAGLGYADIQPVYLAPADARAAFQRGSVDAWVIWDPYFAAAQRQLGARVLADGQGLVDNHQFYLAAGRYAEQHQPVIAALVDAIRATDAWAQANPQQVAAQVAPLLGLPPEIALSVVQREGYGVRYIDAEVTAKQQRIADTFQQLRLIPKPLAVKSAIWTPPSGLAER